MKYCGVKKTLNCTHCKRVYKRESNLKKHMDLIHEKKVDCIFVNCANILTSLPPHIGHTIQITNVTPQKMLLKILLRMMMMMRRNSNRN